MAVPSAPTLITLAAEGLKKAGYSSPTTAQQDRAEDEFIEEVKNDIVNVERRLTSLQTTSVLVTTNGQSRYALPDDYLSDLDIVIMDGTVIGTAQAGASGSITFAADDTEDDKIGKDVIITANTGKGSMSQITAYNSSTKVATVTPNFTTAPDATSTYMQVSSYNPLIQVPIWDLGRFRRSAIRSTPTHYFPMGDVDNGEFILDPVPYRDGSTPWGLQLRYYADLMEIDLAGTLMATLYKKWRNVWEMGVAAKQLQSDDDNRQELWMRRYEFALQTMIAREKYGYDISNLNCTIQDYS